MLISDFTNIFIELINNIEINITACYSIFRSTFLPKIESIIPGSNHFLSLSKGKGPGIQRSETLTGVSIGVVTEVFGVLLGMSTVILIGCTGIGLILLGIAALLLRERIAGLRSQLKGWRA